MTVGVGAGWRPLSEELAAELGRLDPPGELLGIEIDADGLPRFRVRVDRRVRAEGRRLVQSYESRALEQCELCGHAGHVHAGAIVTARCDDCV
jgi:hypothetical protein